VSLLTQLLLAYNLRARDSATYVPIIIPFTMGNATFLYLTARYIIQQQEAVKPVS